MNDLQLFVIYDAADRAYALALEQALARELAARTDSNNRPDLILREGLTAAPAPKSLGALSLVVLVLPGRAFTAAEQSTIEALQQSSNGDTLVLPLSPAADRYKPPPPLDQVVSFPLHDAGDRAQVERLTTLLLNHLGLRAASGRRSVFISYRITGGKALAEALTEGLERRGYKVWRDEHLDRDGLALIAAGSEAQKTLRRAIVEHGFVLLLDTPGAVESRWVGEEVSAAFAYMLPILPVVVEDAPGTNRPRVLQGGRFRPLRELQREVRLAHGAVADESFLHRLERTMSDVLLEHLRTQRLLIHEARRRFDSFEFEWRPVGAHPLLYEVSRSRHSDTTPALRLRFLVQCAPYSSILEQSVRELCQRVSGHDAHCQYGILVHRAWAGVVEREALVKQCGGHIMLLQPDELAVIPDLLSIAAASGGAS